MRQAQHAIQHLRRNPRPTLAERVLREWPAAPPRLTNATNAGPHNASIRRRVIHTDTHEVERIMPWLAQANTSGQHNIALSCVGPALTWNECMPCEKAEPRPEASDARRRHARRVARCTMSLQAKTRPTQRCNRCCRRGAPGNGWPGRRLRRHSGCDAHTCSDGEDEAQLLRRGSQSDCQGAYS